MAQASQPGLLSPMVVETPVCVHIPNEAETTSSELFSEGGSVLWAKLFFGFRDQRAAKNLADCARDT